MSLWIDSIFLKLVSPACFVLHSHYITYLQEFVSLLILSIRLLVMFWSLRTNPKPNQVLAVSAGWVWMAQGDLAGVESGRMLNSHNRSDLLLLTP